MWMLMKNFGASSDTTSKETEAPIEPITDNKDDNTFSSSINAMATSSQGMASFVSGKGERTSTKINENDGSCEQEEGSTDNNRLPSPSVETEFPIIGLQVPSMYTNGDHTNKNVANNVNDLNFNGTSNLKPYINTSQTLGMQSCFKQPTDDNEDADESAPLSPPCSTSSAFSTTTSSSSEFDGSEFTDAIDGHDDDDDDDNDDDNDNEEGNGQSATVEENEKQIGKYQNQLNTKQNSPLKKNSSLVGKKHHKRPVISQQKIKVVARVRPLSTKEIQQELEPCILSTTLSKSDKCSYLVCDPKNGEDGKVFEFDQVLEPELSQNEAYSAICGMETLRQTIFEGYNATILAYGQTGSGKTYSVLGDPHDHSKHITGIPTKLMNGGKLPGTSNLPSGRSNPMGSPPRRTRRTSMDNVKQSSSSSSSSSSSCDAETINSSNSSSRGSLRPRSLSSGGVHSTASLFGKDSDATTTGNIDKNEEGRCTIYEEEPIVLQDDNKATTTPSIMPTMPNNTCRPAPVKRRTKSESILLLHSLELLSPKESDGIIPRALCDLFHVRDEYILEELKLSSKTMSDNDGKTNGNSRTNISSAVSVKLSVMELYNDKMIDLLSSSSSRGEKTTTELIIKDRRHRHIHNKGGGAGSGVYVQGLLEVTVESSTEAMQYINYAMSRRVVSSTAMNTASSRSHAICCLHVEIPSKNICAKLTMVDLAGSERMKKTLAEGMNKTEGISINKDLFVLGKVVSALAEKQHKRSISSQQQQQQQNNTPSQPQQQTSHQHSHIPYRDSKLTRLLKDSLGGSCYTVIVACVSPTYTNLQESINTLRYAQRARKITNALAQNTLGGSGGRQTSSEEYALLMEEVERYKALYEGVHQENGLLRSELEALRHLLDDHSDTADNTTTYQSSTQAKQSAMPTANFTTNASKGPSCLSDLAAATPCERDSERNAMKLEDNEEANLVQSEDDSGAAAAASDNIDGDVCYEECTTYTTKYNSRRKSQDGAVLAVDEAYVVISQQEVLIAQQQEEIEYLKKQLKDSTTNVSAEALSPLRTSWFYSAGTKYWSNSQRDLWESQGSKNNNESTRSDLSSTTDDDQTAAIVPTQSTFTALWKRMFLVAWVNRLTHLFPSSTTRGGAVNSSAAARTTSTLTTALIGKKPKQSSSEVMSANDT